MTDIVVYFLDDLAHVNGTLMAQQGFMKTKFVDEGVHIPRFRASVPRCGPDRAVAWTGLQPWQTFVLHNKWAGVGGKWNQNSTIATALQQAGYLTAFFGKYSNEWGKWGDRSDYQDVPPGWSVFHAFENQAEYFTPYVLRVADLGHDGTTIPENHPNPGQDLGRLNPNTDYTTDLFSVRGVQLIEATDPGTPLFIWHSSKAVHENLRPADRHDGPCTPGTWNPASWNEADVSDKPAYVQDLPLLPGGSQENLQVHCRTLQAVADSFEDTYNAMNAAGRTDVAYFFLSDNGFLFGEHRIPLGKNTPYIGSRGLSFWCHWAGNMGSAPRSFASTDIAGMIDLAPTLADIGGTSLSHTPAGVSLKPKIQAAGGAPIRDTLTISSLSVPGVDDDVPAWIGVETKEGELFVKYHYGDRNSESGRTTFTEYYDPADPDELVNKFGNPAFAVRQAELETLWTAGVGSVKDRAYVEPVIFDTFEDNTAGTTFPLVAQVAVPAGLQVVAVLFAGNALNVTINQPLTDSRGNTWTVLPASNSDNARHYYLIGNITTPIQVGDTVTPTASGPVDERRAVAFPVRNVATTSPLDVAALVKQGNGTIVTSEPLTTLQAGDLVIWGISYVNSGGDAAEGSFWQQKYAYTGTGRHCTVVLDVVFDPDTYIGTAILGNTANYRINGIALKQAGVAPPPPSGTNAGWTTASDALGIAIEVADQEIEPEPPGADPPRTTETFTRGPSGRTHSLLGAS